VLLQLELVHKRYPSKAVYIQQQQQQQQQGRKKERKKERKKVRKKERRYVYNI